MSIPVFTKTLYYNLSPSANPAETPNNTQVTIGNSTIYIPENSPSTPVKIKWANIYTSFLDTSTATGGSVNIFQLSCSLNSGPWAMSSMVGTATNTGENWSYLFGPIDYTDLFTGSFSTNTSASVEVSSRINISTGIGLATRAQYCYLELTYEYSASSARRGQTLKIPIERNGRHDLPTSQTTYGIIPQITGSGAIFENYNNYIIRDSWLYFYGNSGVKTVADVTLSYTFDSATSANVLPTMANALLSPRMSWHHIPYPISSASSTHTFQLWSNVAERFPSPSLYLWVTVDYDPSGMTSILNSVNIPFSVGKRGIAGTLAAYTFEYKDNFIIPENGSIVTKFAAIEGHLCSATQPTTSSIKVWNEATSSDYRIFMNANGLYYSTFLHYINPSNFNLITGSNDFYLYYKQSAYMDNFHGNINLIYESNVYSSGSDYHNKNVVLRNLDTSGQFLSPREGYVVTSSFSLTEGDYYINKLTVPFYFIGSGNGNLIYHIEDGAVSKILSDDWVTTGNEIGTTLTYCNLTKHIQQYNNQYSSSKLIDISKPLVHGSSALGVIRRNGTKYYSLISCCSYYVGGTISGSSGGTITLRLYKVGSLEVLQVKTILGNGSYSFTVWDMDAYQVTAYENLTLNGISNIANPDSVFDISLSSGSPASSSEHSYAWVG